MFRLGIEVRVVLIIKLGLKKISALATEDMKRVFKYLSSYQSLLAPINLLWTPSTWSYDQISFMDFACSLIILHGKYCAQGHEGVNEAYI